VGAYSFYGVLFFVRAYGFALFSLFINDSGLSIFFRVLGASLCFCFAFVFLRLGAADFEGGRSSLPPASKKTLVKTCFEGLSTPSVKKAKNLTPIFPHYAPISRHERAQKSERDTGGAYFFVSSLRIVKTRHRLQREGERRGLLFLNREREW